MDGIRPDVGVLRQVVCSSATNDACAQYHSAGFVDCGREDGKVAGEVFAISAVHGDVLAVEEGRKAKTGRAG